MLKKTISVLLGIMILSVLLTGCGNAESGGKIEGSLTDIMAKVQENAGVDMAVMDVPITEENFTSFLFIDPVKDSEALASEAAINAIAHSIVLLRVPSGTDAKQTAADIQKKMDPRKWICVEAESAQVVQQGDLILLVMSSTDIADKVVANFNALAK